jgi:polyhydroxyalkanoate synthesis regulator phasin
MSLRENPLLKKMIATGEERMSKMAANLLTNEKLMGVVQKTFSAALDAKGLVEKNLQAALSTLNVPTANDVKKLEGKLEELEKVFESLSTRIADLAKSEAAHQESSNSPRA